MSENKLRELIYTSFGEVSAIFMLHKDGRNIVMPTEELSVIAEKPYDEIKCND